MAAVRSRAEDSATVFPLAPPEPSEHDKLHLARMADSDQKANLTKEPGGEAIRLIGATYTKRSRIALATAPPRVLTCSFS